MPLYSYASRDRQGKVREGLKEGRNQEEVLAALQSSGLLVTQIVEVQELQERKKRRA